VDEALAHAQETPCAGHEWKIDAGLDEMEDGIGW
jgi:hypothetical protein